MKSDNQKPITKFWDPVQSIILTTGVYISSQIAASFLLLTIPIAAGVSEMGLDRWLKDPVGQFSFIVLIEALVLLMIWGLLHVKKHNFSDIGLAWPRLKDLGLAAAGFGVYFLLYLFIAIVAKLIFPGLNFQQEQQVGFETARAGFDLILVFISLVILPPIVEEILMRGFLYSGLKTKWPVPTAAVVTSLLFAIAHLQFGSGAPLLWVAALDTFTLSLVLIYLREKTGNLGAPIALHMLKNGLAFTLLFVFQVR